MSQKATCFYQNQGHFCSIGSISFIFFFTSNRLFFKLSGERKNEMLILSCLFDNKEGGKFCGKCRKKLLRICPKCNSENPPETNFCDEYGHDFILPSEPIVKELSFDEKIDKIQRYLPKGLTEKILSQRDKIEGECKQVTVMFCDIPEQSGRA
jgi:hypothetical protein